MKHDAKYLGKINRNFDTQFYKGIPLKQIDRGYGLQKARRFTINNTNQNCWVPNKHLEVDGTIKDNHDIDYIVLGSKKQFELAGVTIHFKVEEV